jgi:hypothetical protein
MSVKSVTRIDPSWLTVKVSPGSYIRRHGRDWGAGEKLRVNPADAAALLRRGMVREVDE